jgi:hypothetical protein
MCLYLLSCGFFQATEMNGGNIELGGNHVLRGAIMNIGENFCYFIIPFFWCSDVLIFYPVVEIYDIVLGNQSTHFVALFQVGISPCL